ncbi:MAG TPA: hypothetical protein VF787_01370 [Thermoanaerobaculia bacterium]
MSTFILRILFTGLMAFVPNENGTEVTVLLLNADHYHTSDGAALQAHTPILYARAGDCTGDCVTNNSTIANTTFRDTPSTAVDSLETALGDGSAWLIAGSDITVEKASSGAANLPAFNLRDNVRGTTNGNPKVIPTTTSEREDISWIASLNTVCGGGCTLDADVFDTIPPELIAARFKLSAGDLYTFGIARIGSDVTPVHFNRLDGTGSNSAYVQAVATWVGADITVTGDSVKFVESKYAGGGRTMTLSPDVSGKVEVAVVNLPPFVPPASSNNNAPQAGKHFEMYYELLEEPPAREERLVPRAGAVGEIEVPEVTWSSIHPSGTTASALLTALRFDVGRTLYDRSLCPPTTWP